MRYSVGAEDRTTSACTLVQSDHVSRSARSRLPRGARGCRFQESGVGGSAGMAGRSAFHAAALEPTRRELSKDGDVFIHETENRGRNARSRDGGVRPVALGLARQGPRAQSRSRWAWARSPRSATRSTGDLAIPRSSKRPFVIPRAPSGRERSLHRSSRRARSRGTDLRSGSRPRPSRP